MKKVWDSCYHENIQGVEEKGTDVVWKSGTGVPPVKSRARCTCHNQTASVPGKACQERI